MYVRFVNPTSAYNIVQNYEQVIVNTIFAKSSCKIALINDPLIMSKGIAKKVKPIHFLFSFLFKICYYIDKTCFEWS